MFRSAFALRRAVLRLLSLRGPRFPTRADIDAVLRVTDSDDHARDLLLVAVTGGTGLRVYELVALDWEQLVSDHGFAAASTSGPRTRRAT
jgi:integrase